MTESKSVMSMIRKAGFKYIKLGECECGNYNVGQNNFPQQMFSPEATLCCQVRMLINKSSLSVSPGET